MNRLSPEFQSMHAPRAAEEPTAIETSPAPATETSPADLQASAILKATSWISEKRPELVADLLKATVSAMKDPKSTRYFVTIGIRGPKGHEILSLWVDLENNSVTPVVRS